jgi:hypothetical protein
MSFHSHAHREAMLADPTEEIRTTLDRAEPEVDCRPARADDPLLR